MTLRIVVMLFVLFGSVSCKEEFRSLVKISVVNNQNVPVNKASIIINKKKIGETSEDGTFTREIIGEYGDAMKFEIIKNSSTHYFSPYSEKIILKPNHQEIIIRAILYSIPKLNETNQLKLNEEDDIPEVYSNQHLSDDKTGNKDVMIEGRGVKNHKYLNLDFPHLNLRPTAYLVDRKDLLLFDDYMIKIVSKKKPVEHAEVYYGDVLAGIYKSMCITNKNGICKFKLKKTDSNISFLIKSENYITKKLSFNSKDYKTFEISLKKGSSLDVFALANTYFNLRGIENIIVYLDSKKIGKTDRFGHLFYHYRGENEELLKINLKSKDFIPEHFSSEMISSPNMVITKILSKTNFKRPLVIVTPVKVTKEFKDFLENRKDGFVKQINKNILDIIEKDSFFKLKKNINTMNLNEDYFVFKPRVIRFDDKNILEMSVYNMRGSIVFSAQKILNLSDRLKTHKWVTEFISNLKNDFPYEGVVLSNRHDKIEINISQQYSKHVNKSDTFEIYGRQINLKGNEHLYNKIAVAEILDIKENIAQAKIIESRPRSIVSRGDKIVINKNLKNSDNFDSSKWIRIYETLNQREVPVANVNLYKDQQWIGVSNQQGKLLIKNKMSTAELKGLILSKNGYSIKSISEMRVFPLSVNMERVKNLLEINSDPVGARVFLDNKYIGRTPFEDLVDINKTKVLVKIHPPLGYKKIEQEIDLTNQLEISKLKEIQFEKDYLIDVNKLLNDKKYDQAITLINSIPQGHSDFVYALSILGDIYFTHLKDIRLAKESYSKIINFKKNMYESDKDLFIDNLNYNMMLFEQALEILKHDKNQSTKLFKEVISFTNQFDQPLSGEGRGQESLAYFNYAYIHVSSSVYLNILEKDRSKSKDIQNKLDLFVQQFQSVIKNDIHLQNIISKYKGYLDDKNSQV